MRVRLLLALALALSGIARATAGADGISKGSQAVVLIALNRTTKAFWMGFCCDSRRRLVLTDCISRGRDSSDYYRRRKFVVVIHPGTPNERMVEAKPVRMDRERKLLLLQLSEPAGELPELPLGDTSELIESMQIGVCRFTVDRTVPKDKQRPPLPQLVRGRIAALERGAERSLLTIRTDIPSRGCNYGTPIISSKGQAIGIRCNESGPPKQYIVALPAPEIRAFLAELETEVTVPKPIPWSKRYSNTTVGIDGISYTAPPPNVLCSLDLGEGPDARPLTVKSTEDPMKWQATFSPLSPPFETERISVRMETGGMLLETMIDDRDLLVNGKPWRLRDIAQLGPGRSVQFQNGDQDQATIAGIDTISATIAGQPVDIPFASIETLRVLTGVACEQSLPYKAWLTVGDTDVADAKGTIAIRPWLTAEERGMDRRPLDLRAGFAPVDWGPAPPVTDRTCLSLPGRSSDCVRAGGGRYLVLPIPALRQAAVVDLALRDTIGYVDLPSRDALVAGGRRMLYVAEPASGVLEEWSLDPVRRTRRARFPMGPGGRLRGMGMGASSDGPLYLLGGKAPPAMNVVDTGIMSPVAIHLNMYLDPMTHVRVADCGTVIGAWRERRSEFLSGILHGNAIELHRTLHHRPHVIPGPRGELVYTPTTGSHQSDLADLSPRSGTTGDVFFTLPTSHPLFYLGVKTPKRPESDWERPPLSVYEKGEETPLFVLPAAPIPRRSIRDPFWARRVVPDHLPRFVPQLGLSYVLPESRDRVLFHTVDMKEELRKTGKPFLVVDSVPPALAKPGTTLRYPIHVASSGSKLTYSLAAGPPGMKVSPTGEVSWDVPARDAELGGIIVSISADDGQTKLHAFRPSLVP